MFRKVISSGVRQESNGKRKGSMAFLQDEVEGVIKSVDDVENEGDDSDGLDDFGSDFSDSDYELSNDDEDRHHYSLDDQRFDDNVDTNEEWGGVSKLPGPIGPNLEVAKIDSDYASSDELRIVQDSEDDGESKPTYPEFNPKHDMSNVEFELGMIFGSRNEFRLAVREYGIQQGRKLDIYKNDNVRVRARCVKNCPWNIYAGKVQGESTFQVRTFCNTHNCGRAYKNTGVTSTWLAKKYIEDVRIDPRWPVKAFRKTVYSNYQVKTSRSQLYRAKSKANKMIHGSDLEQYASLWEYAEELRRSNPGTTAKMEVISATTEEGRPTFKRFYVCLAASKKGFKVGCRKMVGMDGCHLKGPITGQILCAVGVDGNDQSFPLAYAIVEAETKDSWEWFINLLIVDLEVEIEQQWTFINDKQKGLIPALELLVPGAEHRHCAWHLYTNYRKLFKGKDLKDKMQNASKAFNVPDFNKAMSELREVNEDAYKWLAEKHPRHWSRSHFSTLTKCDMLTNNPCESFNSLLAEAREQPIISQLETIRCLIMTRFQVRKEKMLKHLGLLGPKIQRKLEKVKALAIGLNVVWAGGAHYQIGSLDIGQYVVNLNEKTCSCKKWQLRGIPCEHAVAAIYHHDSTPEKFVDDCYLTTTNRKIYDEIVFPMNGMPMWPKSTVKPPLPPPFRKQPGRPKTLRKRALEEDPDPKKMKRHGKKMTCKLCGVIGHNSRGCPQNPSKKGSKGKKKGKSEASSLPTLSSIQESERPSQLVSGHIGATVQFSNTRKEKEASMNLNQHAGTSTISVNSRKELPNYKTFTWRGMNVVSSNSLQEEAAHKRKKNLY